jgi:hypothetical protein
MSRGPVALHLFAKVPAASPAAGYDRAALLLRGASGLATRNPFHWILRAARQPLLAARRHTLARNKSAFHN